MSKFERAINKWRTATERITFSNLDGKAVATMQVEEDKVSVFSNIPYHGESVVINSDYLKDLKRVDDVTGIHANSWEGDVTVSVPITQTDPIEPVLGTGIDPVKWDDIEYVLLATSGDDTRPVLNHVSFEDGRIVATDGYRLHWHDGNYKGGALIYNKILNRIKTDFRISHEDGHSIIEYEVYNHAVKVKTKWDEGSFPNYYPIIPDKVKLEFTLPYDNRMKKLSGFDTVEITVNDKIKIETFANDVVTSLELEGGVPDDIRFGVNPDYLLDAMNGETAKIGYVSNVSPILVGNNALIMPKHLD